MSIILSEFIINHCLTNSAMGTPVPHVRVFAESIDPKEDFTPIIVRPAENARYFNNAGNIDARLLMIADGSKLKFSTYEPFRLCRVTRVLPVIITDPFNGASFPLLDIYINNDDVTHTVRTRFKDDGAKCVMRK
jgi:hypothetical protein